ncbi:Uncharacterized protein TCAP_06272 [Tolypocladium capitatum]|uniref:Protein frg1 n=1 Tax=Tolypocladium capitatum TaxID=45235 RepID=A0A2K3Q8D1_9HYPO|nr:Uncharacterized protein TCAP_06272 [Tolypocladium capitatum]
MSLLINPETGCVTGIVDWAEARILPFGFSIWGLENVLGYMDSKGWHYYDNRREPQDLFWQPFLGEARNASDIDLQFIRAARMAGLFCRCAGSRAPMGRPMSFDVAPSIHGARRIPIRSATPSDGRTRRPGRTSTDATRVTMVKPLTFKGDKKPKKRKRDGGGGAAPDKLDDGEPATRQLQRAADEDGAADDDDSWVSADAAADVVGPVMIVLPTDKPSALACDPSGKVFAMPIENMVDGNPTSAEPHDVRQVWVANRISGTDNYRFKGHHGRYLACDKIGLLSATSEAVSPLECFAVIATADTPGTFQLQTLRDTFLTVKTSSNAGAPAEVRGDADAIAFGTTFRIRMQARFKPKLRASKEEKAHAKISRRELEEAAGRRLDEDEVRLLKRARREGDYHEKLLDIKIKGKHDKFA